jgi:hypothetical protein
MTERTMFASALACALAALTMPAHAQSLFATRGLGLPVASVDARARALGGIGVGIAGLSTSLANPSEIAGLTRTGVTAALQPSSGTVIFGGEESELDGARFPLVRIVFPLSNRLVTSIGYGGVLEQSFGIRTEGTEVVGNETLAVTDQVESTGGLSEVGVAVAWTARPGLALGVGGGLFAGNQRRTVTRTFSDSLVDIQPFSEEFRWEYRAPFVRIGARWDPVSILRLGASLTLAGDIDADGQNERSPDVLASSPIRLTFGGSGFLANDLMLAAGAERVLQGGSGRVFENDPESSVARDTWRIGGGLEWGGLGSGARSWPLRLGASWSQLPYYSPDETPAKEFSVTGGVGFRLAGDPSNPQAVLDATLERGNRSGFESTDNPAGLEERYWRFTISLSLFGR